MGRGEEETLARKPLSLRKHPFLLALRRWGRLDS